jgi:hypothetical protein
LKRNKARPGEYLFAENFHLGGHAGEHSRFIEFRSAALAADRHLCAARRISDVLFDLFQRAIQRSP